MKTDPIPLIRFNKVLSIETRIVFAHSFLFFDLLLIIL